MRSMRDWPIKRKLTAIIMLASGLALTLASITVVTYDLITAKDNLAREMYAFAEVLGDHSASRYPRIAIASIFDPDLIHEERGKP